MTFGTDAAVQNLVWGAVNSAKNAMTTQARTSATIMILNALNLNTEPANPDAIMNEMCNIIAAGIIQTKEYPDKKSSLLDTGMNYLNTIRGENDSTQEWGIAIAVQRE